MEDRPVYTDKALRERDLHASANSARVHAAITSFRAVLTGYDVAAGGMASDADFATLKDSLTADVSAFANAVSNLAPIS